MSKLPATPEKDLYQGIRDILLSARTQVRQTVNTAMVQTYWQIGRLIVEDEQGGEKRAEYGKRVLPELAKRLSAEFGRGFSLPNLQNFRQFYLNFSMDEIRYSLRSELTWTHYRYLIRVENKAARTWYANEAASQNWSVRALDRQISTLPWLTSRNCSPASIKLFCPVKRNCAPSWSGIVPCWKARVRYRMIDFTLAQAAPRIVNLFAVRESRTLKFKRVSGRMVSKALEGCAVLEGLGAYCGNNQSGNKLLLDCLW